MSTAASAAPADPRYVNDQLYDEVVELLSLPQRRGVADPELSATAASVLHTEARLLDGRRYEEWLSMFTPTCVYWLPIGGVDCDPRREVSLTFDDRRRLEDRVARFDTGWAHAQIPPSATVRQVANVEAWQHDDGLLVTSTIVVHEHRKQLSEVYPGRAVHLLTPTTDGFAIHRRILCLINADTPMANVAFIL